MFCGLGMFSLLTCVLPLSFPSSSLPPFLHPLSPAAVALAISRDGSSGGVIRMATIDESGVERKVFTGSDIPTFFDGSAPVQPL